MLALKLVTTFHMMLCTHYSTTRNLLCTGTASSHDVVPLQAGKNQSRNVKDYGAHTLCMPSHAMLPNRNQCSSWLLVNQDYMRVISWPEALQQ